MSARTKILDRIREALGRPTADKFLHSREKPDAPTFDACVVPVPEDTEGRVSLFSAYSLKLKTSFERVADADTARRRVQELATLEGWRQVATHRHALAESCATATGCNVMFTDPGYDRDALEACDAGITSCEALIAQTGSVLVSAVACGGRALTVLPPHHVVIATMDQLLPTIGTGLSLMAEKYGDAFPSMMSLITGPSRTGDIERILVLGAHGPKKLSIFLIG